MPLNGECEYVFPSSGWGNTDIMITHNVKNFRYLINIFVGLLFTEMVEPVIPDILLILTTSGVSLMVFTGSPRACFYFFEKRIFFPFNKFTATKTFYQ